MLRTRRVRCECEEMRPRAAVGQLGRFAYKVAELLWLSDLSLAPTPVESAALRRPGPFEVLLMLMVTGVGTTGAAARVACSPLPEFGCGSLAGMAAG